MNILIVEDDLGIQDLITKTLVDLGHKTESFQIGAKAIELIKYSSIDLVLLDYSLPDLTGEEFILEMQKLDLRSYPEFILMTGRGDERIAVQMMKLGAVDYLIKDANFLSNLPKSISNVIRNIEQKKRLIQVENALIKSENKFKYVLDNAIAVIYNYNLKKQHFEYVSPSVLKIFGIKKDYLLENGLKALTDIINPCYLEQFNTIFAGNLSNMQNDNIILEYQISNSVTGNRWIKDTITIIKNDNEEEVNLIGNALDITEQKLMGLRIQKSEEEYRNMINSFEDVVYVIDPDFRVKIANSNFYSYVDKSFGDPTNRNIFDLIPYLNQKNRKEYQKVFATGDTIVTKETIEVDNETKFVETRKIAVKGDEKTISVITVIRDITQSKKAEKAILESQRLGAVGEMASSVAHDFNNSLQAILGYIDLSLFDENLNAILKQYLVTIKNTVNDAASRIKILQRFGKDKMCGENFKFIDLNLIIRDVIEQSRPLWKDDAEKKGLLININTDCRKIGSVKGNECELRSAVYNIVKNSIEAMPSGGNIYIKSFEEEENAIVEILDTGTGMDEKTRTRVFQPFYSTKGYELGRGLGMSGVYSIIHEHGGAIQIKDTHLGRGTTVKITIPISLENRSSDNKHLIKVNSKMKILWVDDEIMIRELIRNFYMAMNVNGDVASSGRKALELMANYKYDIVITDIGMPEMNGWQLAEEINKRFKNTKVVILSGWGSQVGENKMEKYNICRVLSKPLDFKNITQALKEIYEG